MNATAVLIDIDSRSEDLVRARLGMALGDVVHHTRTHAQETA